MFFLRMRLLRQMAGNLGNWISEYEGHTRDLVANVSSNHWKDEKRKLANSQLH
jgi:hypothetical protein